MGWRMFSVVVDMEHGCFETAIHGFWTLETIDDFRRAVTEAGARIERVTGRPPVSLCDYTNASIQSQEVIAAFAKMVEHPIVRSRRVAMYTGGVMAKMQAQRATRDRSEFRFFSDLNEARAWLYADDDAADRAQVAPMMAIGR